MHTKQKSERVDIELFNLLTLQIKFIVDKSDE
jgi:hypothetical protein